MAMQDAAPDTERDGTNPVLIVGGTVVLVAIVSILINVVGGYQGDEDVLSGGRAAKAGSSSAGACGFGPPDDSYSVALDPDPDPPRPEGTTFRLTVRQSGRPITGAKVCMTADMPDMVHPGLTTSAKEGPAGRYETLVKFGMGGSWKGSVIIAEPGKPVVSVPVAIEVAPVAED